MSDRDMCGIYELGGSLRVLVFRILDAGGGLGNKSGRASNRTYIFVRIRDSLIVWQHRIRVEGNRYVTCSSIRRMHVTFAIHDQSGRSLSMCMCMQYVCVILEGNRE